MAIHCKHGHMSIECTPCHFVKVKREGSLYYDDGQVEIRIRENTPDWFVWNMAPSPFSRIVWISDNSIQTSSIDFEEMVVYPRSDEVLPSVTCVADEWYYAVDEEVCWSFSAVAIVSHFPFFLEMGFKGISVGTYSLLENGRPLDINTTSNNTINVDVKKPCHLALQTKVCGSPCYIIVVIRES